MSGTERRVSATEARLIESDGDLIAPHLLHYEVANALHQQHRSGRVTVDLAALRLDRCLRLPVDAPLHSRALEIAYERHLPVAYDAHYVALAERFRCRCGDATAGWLLPCTRGCRRCT
jgi:predicted nucleic acid-binding protein